MIHTLPQAPPQRRERRQFLSLLKEPNVKVTGDDELGVAGQEGEDPVRADDLEDGDGEADDVFGEGVEGGGGRGEDGAVGVEVAEDEDLEAVEGEDEGC